jgi:uncharacterized zinc-type alcohol dehydrogenase-like protein
MKKLMKAWSAGSPNEKLKIQEFELEELREDQVEVQILACGICASDLDAIKGKYGNLYRFPMVPGHEGVGKVVAIGRLVKGLAIGDRVGLGVYRNTCSTCQYCTSARDNLCNQKEMMFAQNYGCFSDHLRINYRYAFKIPESLASEAAAPLMCAGTTVYAPFLKHQIGHGARVGVLGIGGLGHLALQFANKLGCEVYGLSNSTNKAEFCLKLGAHHFIDTSSANARSDLQGKLDYLLVTAGNGSGTWEDLLHYLAPDGKLIQIGVNPTPALLSPLTLLMGQKTVVGSAAGSSEVVQTMLNFAAVHQIQPIIEVFPFSKINEALDKVASGKVRFRAVLTHAAHRK